ncbi:carbohydrate ABC transporter permease [[Acholeplasma] multilocale]|uniref:carbohydrate ABC transporter permease n=1 Tax=[Acholeplasma] multilocale TaxID=264638 RepID=UPI0006879404|nr:sugar ABC transporter permease [[Acholeplasma] multilocale]
MAKTNTNTNVESTNNGFKLKFFDNVTQSVKNVKNKKVVKKHDSFFIQLIWVTPAFFFLALFTFFAAGIIFKNGFNGDGQYLVKWTASMVNFKNIINDRTFMIAMRNSALYVVVVVPVSMIISIGVAKALSSIINKRIFSFLQGLFFLPYGTSAMAIAMAFSFMFSSNDGGLLNQILTGIGMDPIRWQNDPRFAIWVLLIFGIWRALPFNIIMLTAAFMRVNPQYYAAASIDGMNKTKQFWRISMPGITPMVVYLTTMGIIQSFKAMPLGLFKSESAAEMVDSQTIVFWIYEKTTGASQGVVSYQKAGAASILLLIIILAITILSRIATRMLAKRYK